MTTIILMVWSMPAVVAHCAELAVVSFQTGNLFLQIIRTINTPPQLSFRLVLYAR